MGWTPKFVIAWAVGSLVTVATPGIANAVVCGMTGVSDNLALVEALPGGSCTVEDKTFTFNAASFTQVNFDALTAQSVAIVALASPPGQTNTNPGLRFTGPFFNTSTNMPADLTIGFTVTAGPGFLIDDASIDLSGIVANSVITDILTLTPLNAPGPRVQMMATDGAPVPDPITFGPFSSLSVVEDLGVTSFAPTGLSIIDKRFSEVPVPEPASLALFAVSLLGMGVFGRLRK